MQAPKLTKRLISQSRVVAKGSRIRDVDRLIKKYGGDASKWTKRSSPPVEIEGSLCEIHWYEQHGIGKFEIKVKRVRDL